MSSDAVTTLGNPDATRFGGDIGGGLMAFVGNWGFKADIEYLRAAGSYQTSASQFSTTGGTTTATTTSGSTTPGTGTGTNPSPAPSGPYVSKDTGGTTSAPSGLADTVLSGLHFWRANVGVALRW
jgi:hypothetical protein